MTLWEACWVMVAGLALYFGSAWSISSFCFCMSPIPLAVFIVYPTMKRYTPLAHFGVGLGLGHGPAGRMVRGVPVVRASRWSRRCSALFTLFWVAGFDIIYATLDEEFDRRESLYSFPSRFGTRDAPSAYSALFHVVAFLLLVRPFRLFDRSRCWPSRCCS